MDTSELPLGMMPSTAASRERAWSMPIEAIDPSDGYLFQDDSIGAYLARLRRDAPVHFCASSRFGPYWSITRYRDIVTVEMNHAVFSSAGELGGIAVGSPRDLMNDQASSFIAMDPPRHDDQRKAVAGIAGAENVARLESVIRGHVIEILEGLPVGQTFDWVPAVSIELTTRMLATIFDYPFERRTELTFWSDIATGHPKDDGPVTSHEMRAMELKRCLDVFTGIWNERVNAPPQPNIISMLAHSPATRNMSPMEYLGNLLLLIVGGNDTTRNSISGGILALNLFPEQFAKLRADHALIETLVPEIIRWQTPLAHMARTATADFELNGQTIRQGDRVVMWYLSANRDDTMIDDPEQFIIDRKQARRHLSFGFGIHHCMGSRLAEMQLKVLWQEILTRFTALEVVGQPKRSLSNFVHGFTSLPVRISR
ncbi:MAG: cytochrome P450 [Burkholderiaceae bacterium]